MISFDPAVGGLRDKILRIQAANANKMAGKATSTHNPANQSSTISKCSAQVGAL
jgi:hypothetical protein